MHTQPVNHYLTASLKCDVKFYEFRNDDSTTLCLKKNGPTLKRYSSEILTIDFDVILQKYSKVSRTEFA